MYKHVKLLKSTISLAFKKLSSWDHPVPAKLSGKDWGRALSFGPCNIEHNNGI
jgi:hypothetical protein